MLENDTTEVLPEGLATEAPASPAPATPVATPAADPQTTPQVTPAPVTPQVPFGGQTFDPNNYRMNYRGQQVFPKDAAHAKQLMQQGFSYSQSMEEVGKLRKDLETKTQEMEGTYGKYKEFDERLKNNPDEYTKFEAYFNGNGEQTQPGNGQSFNRVYDEKLQGLEGKIQSLLNANEDTTLRTNMDKIKAQHSQFDWESDNGDGKLDQRVMRHAQSLGLNENQVHLAFQDYHFAELQNQAITNGAAQVSDKVQAQNKAGILQGASATAAPEAGKPIDTKGMSHAQISQLAKAELGV